MRRTYERIRAARGLDVNLADLYDPRGLEARVKPIT